MFWSRVFVPHRTLFRADMFAWKKFLEARNIVFREGGQNEVLVHCPFCGENDPSQHLSISLRGRGWRCLRMKAHSGKAYARLMSNLIGCTEDYAREILGESVQVLPDADQFSETWRKQLGMDNAKAETRPSYIDFAPEMKPLSRSRGRLADLFWDYLGDRGYSMQYAEWLAETYRLQYAVTGYWAYRMIVPVFDSSGKLMTWTGRSVLPDAKVRYVTLNSESSVVSPTNLLLGLDFLWRAYRPRCLVVTEGPFDAMAITALGHQDGIYGTCLFGVQVSDAQANLLADLSNKFERMRLLVDPDARMKVLGFRDRLPRKCQVKDLREGLKDPGELPKLGLAAVDYLRTVAI